MIFNMNILEGLLYLENGFKRAKTTWEKDVYIFIDEEDGNIKWQNGDMYYEKFDLESKWRIIKNK